MRDNFYEIDSYSVAKSGLKGRVKSPILYGHDKNQSVIFPLAYIKKPKWIKQKDFEKILDSIQLNLKKGEKIEK